MQNYNQTISSLVRIAQQLDEAGLYEQSDLVHESLLRIAQISPELKSAWGLNNPIVDFFKSFRNKPSMPSFEDRDQGIEKILSDYSTKGTIPKDFIDLLTSSAQFRSDLSGYLRGYDFLSKRRLMGPRDDANLWILDFDYLIEESNKGIEEQVKLIDNLKKQIALLESTNPDKADFLRVKLTGEKHGKHSSLGQFAGELERLEAKRKNLQRLIKNKLEFKQLKLDRKEVVSSLLAKISPDLHQRLSRSSKNFTNNDVISPVIESLKELQNDGVGLGDLLKEIIEQVSPESGSYLKKRTQALQELKPISEMTDEELEEYMKIRRRERELAGLSATDSLTELEKQLGISDNNPNVSQYPKASETSPVSQQQTIGGQKGDSGKGPSSVSRTIKKPSKPSQPNIQRVRFKSPGNGNSAVTIEEFFKLVSDRPDRWEQFNNNNKDPKLKLDEIKKLLKAIGAKIGKGSVTLSDVIKRINFNDPRLQLIEPAIEIAFNEFGKYLENPSSYSSNLKPNIDEIKKFFSPILAWQELVKNELKTKSVNELLKYFTNNNPSVSIQGPTSPGLTKGINAGPLFEIGNINYRFNDLSNKEKEDIIYMIKNGGNLPKSQSEIENEQREQMRKLQEKYPLSGQGDLRLQQQRNMMQ